MSERHGVDIREFATTVGEDPGKLPDHVRHMLQSLDGAYRPATREEQDEAILTVLKRLHTKRLARSTAENLAAFERGWTENLELCRVEGVSAATLRPKYVRPFKVIRYGGRYVVPDDPYLTDDLWTLVVAFASLKYLAGVKGVYEFGTGTGRYLYLLTQILPDKKLTGLDWTEASMAILELIGKATGHAIAALRFDMVVPDVDVRLDPESGVFTVGSMEQVGDRFEPFLEYLLVQRPRIVVHLEPILEFYREDVLFDYLAILYHRYRNYLCGYFTALRRLAEAGRVEIIEARRLYYGDLYNEGSSLIVWRPR